MKIIQNILTKNDCYLIGEKITVKGLMLHSVGCSQPSASVFVETWNRGNLEACVHAFIDGNTGDVHQTLPWNHRGWHGGDSSNNTHIGVEMCEPACVKYFNGIIIGCSDKATARAVVQRTYDTAVQLFAHLCVKYKLNPMGKGVIVSHSEGHKMGIASGHADPEHLWKYLGMGYTMDTFRKAVKKQMEGDDMTKEEVIKIIQEYEAEKAKKATSDWAKSSWTKAKKKGIMDGTSPKSHATREQVATILDRLGLLK